MTNIQNKLQLLLQLLPTVHIPTNLDKCTISATTFTYWNWNATWIVSRIYQLRLESSLALSENNYVSGVLTSTNDTRLNRQTGLIASRNTARVTTKHRQPWPQKISWSHFLRHSCHCSCYFEFTWKAAFRISKTFNLNSALEVRTITSNHHQQSK